MSNQAAQTKPILGQDLDALREKLGLSVGEACWLYGMSMTKWTNIVRTGAKTPIKKPTLSLLARGLSNWPEVQMFAVMPTAQDIYARLQTLDPEFGLKRMAIMFGSETTAGYRWITMGSNLSTAVQRLLYVFQILFDAAAADSFDAAVEFVESWEQMVNEEAQARGIYRIFSVGCWTKGDDAAIGRPTLGQDLNSLREELGLSTMDAQLLYGLSATKWMNTATAPSEGLLHPEENVYDKPLENVSLALLVRVLRAYPDLCPMLPVRSAADVYERVKVMYGDLPLRKFSTLFGSEVSSGYRWVTMNSKISPLQARLFEVFMQKSSEFEDDNDALMAFAAQWFEMVMIEGEARGISDVFNRGIWDLNDKTIEKIVRGEERDKIRAIKEEQMEARRLRREAREAKALLGPKMKTQARTKLSDQIHKASREIRRQSKHLLVSGKSPAASLRNEKAIKAVTMTLMQAAAAAQKVGQAQNSVQK